MNNEKYFELLNNSTLISNINSGIAQPSEYFGKKTNAGMAYQNNSEYNNMSTIQANNTKAQSNYMTPNKVM